MTRSKPSREARRSSPIDGVRAGGRRPASALAFPVVGVGASAGGLDAFRQLLAHVPADSGLALVLVQHLEPSRASLLSDALAQATAMKVAQAEQGARVEPNCVYVIPPGVQIAIEQGALALSPLEEDERRPHLPIDFFLRSLAAERGRQSIGVVLSGTASDGTAGLAAIRAHGGITFAQDPRSARFGEMPQSAVDAGVVDFCLTLPALGAELARLARHPYLARSEPAAATPAGAASLAQVVALVRASTGVDFGEHKPATFKRRLARRMAVRKVQDVASYLDVLRQDPAEVRSLYDDLLIKVTSFFRDGCFDELKAIAFPEILRQKAPGAPIRAWVVGCATGEEVYSLAISLLEHLGDGPSGHPVLIFGSDLSERAVEAARAGLYPDAAVRGLGEERLKRFFVRTERGWRVTKAVRELCVFVRHDVARDPPFSRLDLVSCRNVLIYFGQALQRRVLAAAHYCLNQPGFLLLGRSESASSVPRLFAPAGKGGSLFLRKSGPSTYRFAPHAGVVPSARPPSATDDPVPPGTDGALARHVDDLVLARYGPPGVVVNDRLEVIQFRGRTGPYLEQPEGDPQNQLLKLARAGLAGPLRIALAQARKTLGPVRKERVAIERDGTGRSCDLVVLPVEAAARGGERAFVVLFEERPPAAPDGRAARPRGRTARRDAAARRALEEELASTKEYAATLLEDHGRSSDALASANDELVSGNEELQSLNEELETAKEELQGTNEELTTVNDELHGRNRELQLVNADVLNLLDAVEIPIVILDEGRRVRRITRCAPAFMGLTQADVGRRITDVALPLQAPDLEQWITRAMKEAILVEAEVKDHSGRWHRLQIRPYRASDGRTDGAILSLVDIDELRHEVSSARWARDYARSIVEAVQVPLVVLGAGLRVLSANGAYYRLFEEKPADTEGHGFFELGAGRWDSTELHRAVDALRGAEGRFQALELERELPGAGRRAMSVSGCAVSFPGGEPMVLLAIEDVTERREGERRGAELLALAEEARQRAERADAAKDLFLTNLSHELRNPLGTILLRAQALQSSRLDARGVERAGAAIERSAKRQQRLVEDLLDVSGIVAGKLRLALVETDLRALALEVLEAVKPEADAKSVQLAAEPLDGAPLPCLGDPGRLQQVVANLLSNAVKFTPSGGRVTLWVDAVDGGVRLVVTDTGRGIAPAFLPHAFERFAREEGSTRLVPGLGLGLALVRHLVELHGGAVRAESPGRDLGSTFTVTLPRHVAPGLRPGG